jgi:hypothetical protein
MPRTTATSSALAGGVEGAADLHQVRAIVRQAGPERLPEAGEMRLEIGVLARNLTGKNVLGASAIVDAPVRGLPRKHHGHHRTDRPPTPGTPFRPLYNDKIVFDD